MLKATDDAGNVLPEFEKVLDIDIKAAAEEITGKTLDQNLLSVVFDYEGNLWFATGGFRIYPERKQQGAMGYISREAIVFIISLFPILELRGGILASSLLDVTMWKGILISAVGNILPIPFILFFIKKIFTAMKKTKLLRPLVEKMENKAMKKRDQIEKYEFWGLVLFVGIPLPGTGAWTGALVASLIDMDIKKAFKAILLGICLAAVIMTLISYGVLGHIIR